MKYALMALLLFSGLLNAAPAFERLRTFTQPDGTTFQGRVKGDEYFHWIETERGEVLVFNKQNGRYEAGEIADGALNASGRAFDPSQQMMQGQSITPAALQRLWLEKHQKAMELRRQR